MENIKLFNTLSRKVEDFISIDKSNVKLYTCGPTVYNFAHIGNLRTYIFEDILKRTLKTAGYNVFHVMNVTDVGHLTSDEDSGEDKMEVGAERENKSAYDIAEFYFQSFRKDLKRLNIAEPDIWSKATEHIKEQIEFVKVLEEKGYTYILGDGVYFDTSKVKDYGKLAQLNIEGLKAGARIEFTNGKKNITDFALWKFSPKGKKRQMEWDSPWGVGFPGWHIECSSMAMKYLGDRIDIHCGGIDHIPIHHTNEIAQSESYLGHKWVNYWMHGEFLMGDKEEKMSKSGDNFLTVDTLVNKGYDPLVYRYYCLNAHYRKALAFSPKAIEASGTAFNKLKAKVIELKKNYNKSNQDINLKYLEDFYAAARNDLNVPLGIGIMWNLINDNTVSDSDKYSALLEMDKILGLGFNELKEEEEEFSHDILNLVNQRQTARKNRDFKTADKIRDELLNKGIVVEDTSQGVKLKKVK